MKPPYNGFTWHLSQHAAALEPKAIFGLLKAAALFSGQKGRSQQISESLIADRILTDNRRRDSERPDPWRDYQQILPELGLLVSTEVRPEITLTPAGLLLLDGSLGISETLTNQVLKYQYPNGFKWQISPKVKAQAGDRFNNFLELQLAHQILVRPAVLILRILITLITDGQKPEITADECQGFLLCVGKQSQWRQAYSELLAARKKGHRYELHGVRRNVLDWFKLLSVTDLFILKSGGISLSATALADLPEVTALCKTLEDPETFWIPPKPSAEARYTWFLHFGNYDVTSQWVTPELTGDYVEQNYLNGISGVSAQSDGEIVVSPSHEILLKKFASKDHKQTIKTPQAFDLVAAGEKAHAMTLLHDKVCSDLAAKLLADGYAVETGVGGADESVDLLARKGRKTSIFEVKTITRRNWRQRLRHGLGQLAEYRFRWEQQYTQRPGAVLVMSSKASLPPWYCNFFETDAKMGLIGYSAGSFIPYTKLPLSLAL